MPFLFATHPRVAWYEIHIYRLEGGKICEHWAEIAMMELLQQIGALPQLGPLDQTEAEKSIREMQDVFLKGLLTRDPKLRASIWTADGTLGTPQGGFCRGRAEVEKYFHSEDASTTPISKASFSNYRFSFVNGQAAFVEVDLTLNIETGDGHTLDPLLVSVSFVAVKRGDKWWVQDERAAFRPMAAGAK